MLAILKLTFFLGTPENTEILISAIDSQAQPKGSPE